MQDRLSIPCQSTNHTIRSRQMPLSQPQFLFCLFKEDILKPKVIILINNLTIYSAMVGHSYHAFKVSTSGKGLRILKVIVSGSKASLKKVFSTVTLNTKTVWQTV